MTEHLEFRENRQLSSADLNAEALARDDDLAQHRALAHPSRPAAPGLAGHRIVHPSGGPSIDLTSSGPAAGVRAWLPDGVQALRLSADGGHRVSATVTSTAADVVATQALRLPSGAAARRDAAPWSVRAVDLRTAGGPLTARELRIELAAPPGSALRDSRFSAGTIAGGVFSPVITADAGGSVTIPGDLAVTGSVSQGEIPADPQDPRFAAILRDLAAQRVVAAAVAQTNTLFGLAAAKTVAGSSPQQTVFSLTITPLMVLAAWCAAVVSTRGSTRHVRLLRAGNNAPKTTAIRIDGIQTWSPDVSMANPASLAVAVGAFEPGGSFAAQQVGIP